ncbi:MAG: DUF1036 domain-containing protein [Leptolyngbyaceae cyanobacterium SM1_3_5]|nr:DUF1036 domain-containing protein [Leptolyngbyaceae cyanobacterium SM1_3_5]
MPEVKPNLWFSPAPQSRHSSSKLFDRSRFCTGCGCANAVPHDTNIGQNVDDASTNYNVRGWWEINPGGCSRVTNEPANRVVRGNNLYYISHRYYARSVDSNNNWTNSVWSGTEIFCVRNASFNYFRSLGGFGTNPPLICPGGYRREGFRSFSSQTINKTINLTRR